MFKCQIDLRGVDNLCRKLKKDLSSVKGVKAGYIRNQAYPNGLSLAENALIQENEYGIGDIPPRPFLRNTIIRNQEDWKKTVIENFDANQDGTMTMKKIAAMVGNQMQADIVRSIDSDIPPPNKESTIRKKKSSHTLIDTGMLRKSVHHKVIKR